MSELDQRIVKVAIIVGDKITWYEGLNIEAKGIKKSNTIMNQCEVVILNISRAAREQILKETNPFLQRGKRISIIVEVGRVSTGTTTLYTGTVFRSQSTPKPNVGVRLTCIQGYDNRSKIVSRSASEITDMSSISAWVAEDNGYKL